MTRSHSFSQSAPGKKVDIRERSFTLGNITGINGYRVNLTRLKQRFSEGGYLIQETPHFLVMTREAAPSPLLVHWFSPQEINANLGDSFLQELKPLGLLTRPQDFGNVFGVIVFSLSPYDAQRALKHYGTNTLQRYQDYLKSSREDLLPASSTMHSFAQVYRRVIELCIGESFLDVGCSFGFFPLLVADLVPTLTRVVGIDIQAEPFPVVRSLADEQGFKNVSYLQADVLSPTFSNLGQFDTVAAIHILEHLSEADMHRALVNLLKVTSRRLMVAVPYEEHEPEVVHGHEQLFTRAKLEEVGTWCLRHLEGAGRVVCEDCAGGLLLVERHLPTNEERDIT